MHQINYKYNILLAIHHLKDCTYLKMGFPDSSVGKESACNAGDHGSIPGLGRSPGEGIGYTLQYSWASLLAQLVKNLPAMWETWVGSLGWIPGLGRSLEKEKTTHSSILAWRIPWTVVHGVAKSDFHTIHKHTFKICSSLTKIRWKLRIWSSLTTKSLQVTWNFVRTYFQNCLSLVMPCHTYFAFICIVSFPIKMFQKLMFWVKRVIKRPMQNTKYHKNSLFKNVSD